MVKKLVVVLGALLVLICAVFVIGMTLPERHSVTREAIVERPPADVWALVRDFERAPEWQPGVESIERIPSAEGREAWSMEGSFGTIPLEVVEETPGRRLATRIADESLPFGGVWVYELEPVGEGTRITITEDGYVTNPLFRFMSRFVFGYERTIEEYLEGLQQHFGEA